uniref:WPP domain-containing protein n=2 Tax=Guillardia theta TaxID=55529 RepID=A0A7S4V1E0_GUITH|mmetsp:Transcript_8440/g.28321  ORF Transcript_8440/g.28321 Transcript_8440/m.28321 type:complete len:595 (+) Transcript_8440:1-1785(+)
MREEEKDEGEELEQLLAKTLSGPGVITRVEEEAVEVMWDYSGATSTFSSSSSPGSESSIALLSVWSPSKEEVAELKRFVNAHVHAREGQMVRRSGGAKGSRGQVMEVKHGADEASSSCSVVWEDSKTVEECRIGKDGEFELILDSKPSSIASSDLSHLQQEHVVNKLTRLVLDGNHLGDVGATALGAMLSRNQSLSLLSLCDNWIGPEGSTALAEGMKGNEGIETLRLNGNVIGNQGMPAFLDLLGSSPSSRLSCLELSGNAIGQAGVRVLARALVDNSRLTRLDLSHNLLGADGAAYLRKGLERSVGLRELLLDRNMLGDSGFMQVALAFSQGMKGAMNRSLTLLSVAGNNISDKGVMHMRDMLGRECKLSIIELEGNEVSPAALALLHEKLAVNAEAQQLEAAVIKLQKVFRGSRQRAREKRRRRRKSQRSLAPPPPPPPRSLIRQVSDALLKAARAGTSRKDVTALAPPTASTPYDWEDNQTMERMEALGMMAMQQHAMLKAAMSASDVEEEELKRMMEEYKTTYEAFSVMIDNATSYLDLETSHIDDIIQEASLLGDDDEDAERMALAGDERQEARAEEKEREEREEREE